MAALRLDGTTACMTLEGTTDTESFRAYVEAVLVPALQPGDVVVMGQPVPAQERPHAGPDRAGGGPSAVPARLLAGSQSH